MLCCRECGSDRVELLAAQVATDETPTRHVDGRAERAGLPSRAAAPDPDKSRDHSSPRVTITYRCEAGHTWAAVQTFFRGQTFTFPPTTPAGASDDNGEPERAVPVVLRPPERVAVQIGLPLVGLPPLSPPLPPFPPPLSFPPSSPPPPPLFPPPLAGGRDVAARDPVFGAEGQGESECGSRTLVPLPLKAGGRATPCAPAWSS